MQTAVKDASAILNFLCNFGTLIDQLREKKKGETVSQFLYKLKRLQQIKKKKKEHADREKTHGKTQREEKRRETQIEIKSNKQRRNTQHQH